MRRLILTAFALTTAVSMYAQGTVYFTGYPGSDGLHTSHVWAPSSTLPALALTGNGPNDGPPGTVNYAGAGMALIGSSGLTGRFGAQTTFAQLLFANGANRPEASLVPGGQTTTFRTGGTVGRINTIGEQISGLIPDQPAATFEMVAWDNSSGLYTNWTQASAAWLSGLIAAGKSGAFTVANIGGIVNFTPDVLAQSFNLLGPCLPEPAGLFGDSMTLEYRYGGITNVHLAPQAFVAGPQVEFPTYMSNPSFAVDVGNSTITFSNWSFSGSFSGPLHGDTFNGVLMAPC
jgi:hypothetical protein